MPVTMTSPASPQAYLEIGLRPVTATTVHFSRRHRRIIATGSGLSGLTATKAMKHSQFDISDALVFLSRFAAQGSSHLTSQTWFHVIPATAAASTVFGVLVTLCVAIGRERRVRRGEHLDQHQNFTAAQYFNCDGRLPASHRTQKVGADHVIHRVA
ncbi:MAG: hypothetical protein JOZ00_09980 [Mycobacterium sp.]|uniref:hypothetical protein n=1 Tax=Mycobacterium sp. TaxID=1785 RepID=UPI001EC33E71|nr:hypothetical protein [Mycobacterium sp.]MBV8787003.1 hypothetical protein [Mycobacterium sp.]